MNERSWICGFQNSASSQLIKFNLKKINTSTSTRNCDRNLSFVLMSVCMFALILGTNGQENCVAGSGGACSAGKYQETGT